MAVRGHDRSENCAARKYKPEWAQGDIRLDPGALPQRLNFSRVIKDTRVQSPVEFTVNDRGAVMKQVLESGLPLSMALPTASFRGVAARAYENEDGSGTVTLELLHSDAHLCVPLCVSDTIEQAADDWRDWSKTLGLPMLLIDELGEIHQVDQKVGITSRTPKARRRRVSMLKRRPNFLRRRKTGMIGPVVRLSAEEIIARN